MNEVYEFLQSLDKIGISAQSDVNLLYCFMFLKATQTGTQLGRVSSKLRDLGLPNDSLFETVSSSNFDDLYKKYQLLLVGNFKNFASKLLPFQLPLVTKVDDLLARQGTNFYKDSYICSITIAINLFKKYYLSKRFGALEWLQANELFAKFWYDNLRLSASDFEQLCYHA